MRLCPVIALVVCLPLAAQQKHAVANHSHAEQVLGIYARQEEPEVQVAVSLRDGHLFAEGARSPRVELQSSKDPWTYHTKTLEYHFLLDGVDHVTGMTTEPVGNHVGDVPTLTFDRTSSTPAPLNHFRAYSVEEHMVPMRDGVKLHVKVLKPVGYESGPQLPFLMMRTPYGVGGYASDTINASKPEMAASGYIFVFADIRGRYQSEGQFVMNRPVVHVTGDRTDPKLIDESTDTYDTVEWLLKNIANNNGRVGVMGVSYPGFLSIMAAIDHHPAVKAVSPQAPMTDIWLGDDFFHNGAFRQTYGFDYVQELEAQKTDKAVSMKEDTYDYFLRYGNFASAAKAAGMEKLPSARHFIDEPAYTKFWQDMSVLPHLDHIEVPTLEVGGWFDQEDMYGTQAEYMALHPHNDSQDPSRHVWIVLGPWNHGQWGQTTRHLGALDFGAATGDQYRTRYEFPFFEKYLKDQGGFDLQDTASFRTGENKWHTYSVWPPQEGFHKQNLYLQARHGLSYEKPGGTDDRARSSYVADPSNPIPYRERPIESTYGEGSHWRPWLSFSQKFLANRKDIINFSSPVLEKDTTITGDIVADIFASTTGSDADWVVKLIDVFPDDATKGMAGFQMMVVDEIFRGRYRNSFERPEAIKPNTVTEYKWSLHGADHTFLKGHRMLVQIQSTWFPLYDRNPQTFVPNIMTALPDAYKAQTQTIYFSKQHPSHLEVLVPDSESVSEK